MAVGKVFMSGNSQAVRLPKEFRFDVDEVEITREGDGVMMRPRSQSYGLRLVELLQQLSDEIEIPEDLPPQQRADL